MEKMKKSLAERKNAAIKWIVIAIMLMLISMIGVSVIQTSGGSVTVKDLQFETTLGYKMSGLLLKPKDASETNKKPAVIVCHGMYNNREMQDINYVELSRRGYVVLAIDMFSHGKSQNLESEEYLPRGVSEAVKMAAALNYVDTGKIGVTGHSMGGMNCNVATLMDNSNEHPLISALLLNSCFATYKDEQTNDYQNLYGNRDVGIIAGQYDEFLFRESNENGQVTLAKDFIHSQNAQSFLNFGKYPEQESEREANTLYYNQIAGKDAFRVIYTPAIIHPWSHFSKRSAMATIEFFDKALGTPNPIPASNQIWQLKELFNFLGLIGFSIFAVKLTILLVHTPLFASLRWKDIVKPAIPDKKSKYWGWGSLVLTAVFGAAIYLPVLILLQSSANKRIIFSQNSTFGIGVWSAAVGLFVILSMVILHKMHLVSETNLKESGIIIGIKGIGKTVLLAVTVVMVSYAWVFSADYFFQADFRIWVLAAKAFDSDKVGNMIFPNAVLFLVFFIANSISVNCFHYITSEGRKNKRLWGNTLLLSFFTAFPVIILLILQYSYLGITGEVLFSANNAHSYIVWLFPMAVILPVSVIMGRKIYRETNNPYLSGMINALLVTMITCANTATWK